MSLILSGLLFIATLAYVTYTLFFIRGLLKPPATEINPETPDVAVVVAARNEEIALPQLLEDLLAQDYMGRFDVYIANDRSSDGTGQLLEKFAKRHPNFHPVQIVKTSEQMTPKKHALTECLKQTRAELVLATDADCRMGAGWISSAVRQLDKDTGILVGYAQVQANSFFERYQALDYVGIVVSNAGMMNLGYAWSGSGANLAYRRSAFTSIGGFNPVAEKVSGDDFYMVQTIPRKTGSRARFNFDPAHFVRTRPTASIPAFLTQRIRWSSNSRGLEKTDPRFFSFLVSAFLTNLTLLLALLLGLFNPWFWVSLMLKLAAEGTVMLVGAKRFGYGSLLWVFPLWFLLQPLYISFVGIMGLRGKFQWKT